MKMMVSAFNRDPRRLADVNAKYPSVEFVLPNDREQAVRMVADADAVFGWLNAEEFAAQRQLRWVQSASAGVEWIWRVPGLAESDVVVTNMRGAHAATIAEHAFAMLLSLTRGLRKYEKHQRRHEWAPFEERAEMRSIVGLTMGIIGYGNIGRAIARRARAFEMRVLAVDAEPVAADENVDEVWPLERLDDLCRAADVLTISAPITPSSRGMIGPQQLKLLKRGSYLLQMSRGGICDETALVDSLEEGHLMGAGLDVTATEPLPEGDPLWTAPNLVLTPHMSAASRLTSDLVYSILTENVGRFLNGEELFNIVDKCRGY